MKKFNFAWGDTVVLSELLKEKYDFSKFIYTPKNLLYPDPKGNPELIEHIRKINKINIGTTHKYYLITNGAQHAINLAFSILEPEEILFNPPHFMIYPEMVKSMGKTLIGMDQFKNQPVIELFASPNNPDGKMLLANQFSKYKIWDGVYANNIYRHLVVSFENDIFVSNFGKLIGTSNLRLGYLGTNNKTLYEKLLKALVVSCHSVNTISEELTVDILNKIDIEAFMYSGRMAIDDNKDIVSKLEKFTDSKIPNTGMFFWARADEAFRKLLDKSGVQYITGDKFGKGFEDFIRLNLAQNRNLTKNMIKTVLKTDKS